MCVDSSTRVQSSEDNVAATMLVILKALGNITSAILKAYVAPRWTYCRDYTKRGMRRWIFHATFRNNESESISMKFKFSSNTATRRHNQIQSTVTPTTLIA